MTDKINDVHLHLGYSDDIMRGLSFNDVQKFKEENNIENMLLFPFYNERQDVIDNTHTMIAQLHDSDKKIRGLYWLNDNTKFITLEGVFAGGFVGFKYHGAYTGLPISDVKWEQTLTNLNTKNGILLVHCGMFDEGRITSNTSFYHTLLVANRYRDIKVILGHAGGSMLPIIKRCCQFVKDIPNIWLETSGISTPVAVDYIANTVGVQKILFGSDAPWCSFKSALYNVLDCNLPESKKKLILHENYLNMLKS